MPKIAINIVTHNSATIVGTCITAVQEQQWKDYCITVIDNASSDGTQERVDVLGITLIQNTVNRGYSAAHNQALSLTDSDYVLTLNPDVCLEPQYLTEISRPLEADRTIGSAS